MKHFSLKTKVVALLTAAALLLPGFTGAAAWDGKDPALTASRSRIHSIIAADSVADALKPPTEGIHKAAGIEWRRPELERAAQRALEEIVEWFHSLGYDDHYPDTYAGVYRDVNRKLVVMLVDGDPVLKQQILDVVTDDSMLVFESAALSRNELSALMDEIRDSYMSGHGIFYDLKKFFYIGSYGVSDKHNAITVDVLADPDTAAALVMCNAAFPHIIVVPHGPIEPEEDAQPTTLSDMVTAAADALLSAGKL